ncbi:MAG TPA: hypothetical protein VFB38_00185 [Chthonomonadaceae bacterium]|nr:hypothetical protein [Chthonomonadaceae bacterium]
MQEGKAQGLRLNIRGLMSALEGSNDRRSFFKMPEHERYAENAPGPFYVEKDYCLICCLPEQEAPDLMGFIESPTAEGSHCYFKKQPATPEEMTRAVAAVRVCCCGALRYASNAPAVLQSLREAGLREAGLEEQCDELSE